MKKKKTEQIRTKGKFVNLEKNLQQSYSKSCVQWHMSVIPVLVWQRQKILSLEANMGYIVRLCFKRVSTMLTAESLILSPLGWESVRMPPFTYY
jgi:hypothetical protein